MKNAYEVRGDVTAIFINSPKYGRLETLISTNKLQMANEFLWTWYACYSKDTDSFYVQGDMSIGSGHQRTVMLHRWITHAPSNFVCDHINHDTLNNTDENLRLITNAENQQNRKGSYRNSSSGIRGVYWFKRDNKWRASIRMNKKYYHLGYFDNIEDARIAVESAREKMMPFSKEANENAN